MGLGVGLGVGLAVGLGVGLAVALGLAVAAAVLAVEAGAFLVAATDFGVAFVLCVPLDLAVTLGFGDLAGDGEGAGVSVTPASATPGSDAASLPDWVASVVDPVATGASGGTRITTRPRVVAIPVATTSARVGRGSARLRERS